VAALLLLVVGCPGGDDTYDFDGDGTVDSNDCAPEDPAVYPEAPDDVGDGVDSDCDGVDGTDDDGDGFASPASGGDDCNDDDFNIHPGATEIADDNIDQDCDGEDLVCNADGDAMTSIACGGEDCDDNNNACTDDCDDLDEDGQRICDGDCDDTDPFRHPGLTEVCDGLDNDCDLSTTAGPDELDDDFDGWLTCTGGFEDHGAIGAADQPILGSGDCDDEDGNRFPGNPDVCDGVDNDCDGVVDQDDPDEDGDGFADCLDCDDDDPNRFPGAEEACDGLDTDCDEATTADGGETDTDGDGALGCEGDCDDDDPEQQPGQTWYPDGDGDGFGNINVLQTQCARPTGYVTTPGDCNDTDPDAFPGNPEVCDGADNDCDGALPADEADADADAFMPCTGDCDDSAEARFPGNPEVCDGVDNDCDLVVPADEDDADGDGFKVCEGDCDDGDEDEFPGQNWYVDIDGDGFGGGTPFVACEQPANTSTDGTDCDDALADRFPGNPDVCDGLDNDCDLEVDQDFPDDDADGFADCLDCDDDDDTRFPGAAEACNEIDDDCDGVVPTDETDDDGDGTSECDGDCDDADAEEQPGQTWHPDADGDEFGNLNVVQVLCPRPAGWITDGDDCDDDDATAFPGNPEVCDGVDNDCEGLPADETDADGDGLLPCTGDCDDDVAAIFPGNSEECDGYDNDCDPSTTVALGELDNDTDRFLPCALFVSNGATNASGDVLLGGNDCADNDGHRFPTNPEWCDGIDNDCIGSTTVELGENDIDGDQRMPCANFIDHSATNTEGEPLLGGDDCDDDEADTFPGNPEVSDCDGFDNDCVYDGDEVDDDGDGWFECAGDCDDDADDAYPGNAEVCDGYDSDCVFDGDEVDDDSDGWFECEGDCDDSDDTFVPGLWEDPDDGVDNDCDGQDGTGLEFASASIVGTSTGEHAGAWVTGVGDVDGDGLDDVVVAAPDWDPDGETPISTVGRLALFTSAQLQVLGAWDFDQAWATVERADGAGFAVSVAAAGDVDGDDLGDLLARGPQYEGAWMFFGSTLAPGGSFTSDDFDAYFDFNVSAMTSVGDLDGDDLDEVALSTGINNGPAYVYVFAGADLQAGGTFVGSDAFLTINGQGGSDEFGDAMDGGGNIDGDGLPELLVGDAISGGAAYVFTGAAMAAGGELEVTDATASVTYTYAWPYTLGFGDTVAFVPDFDGDGLTEVLVGTQGSDQFRLYYGATWSGGGPSSVSVDPDIALNHPSAGSQHVASAGDVDGDGLGDILLSSGGSNAHLVLGSTLAAGGPIELPADYLFSPPGGVFEAPLAVLDIDGDGLDDLLAGAPSSDYLDPGVAYLVLSPF